jgi:hypothetical protein
MATLCIAWGANTFLCRGFGTLTCRLATSRWARDLRRMSRILDFARTRTHTHIRAHIPARARTLRC